MSSLPFDSSSSWDSSSSGHHNSSHHYSDHHGSGHHGSSSLSHHTSHRHTPSYNTPHHHTPRHIFQGDHTHSGSYSSSYSSKHYHSHSNAHQNSPYQGVHQSWQKSSVSGTYGYHTGSGYTSSGTHYSSGYHTQFNALSHHTVKHSVMNCSSSDDISVVKIWPDGDIYWKGSFKGSLQGIYIKNNVGTIVAKFVDHRVWLWSGDRYVDVGYAQNAQEAVYDVCVKYRALGS